MKSVVGDVTQSGRVCGEQEQECFRRASWVSAPPDCYLVKLGLVLLEIPVFYFILLYSHHAAFRSSVPKLGA